MRKINTSDFRVARRTTSREVNRQIALNVVREHQPISRAQLARKMDIGRGVISVLVNELIESGNLFEGSTGDALRGRKPVFLHVKTSDRYAVAVDVRFSETFLMLTDFSGRRIALERFPTYFDPKKFTANLAERISSLLDANNAHSNCEGIGLVVPGIVESHTGLIIKAPTLGWEMLDISRELGQKTGLPVQVENAAKACALAQMWLVSSVTPDTFVHLSVSDGVGVGIVYGGEIVRGRDSLAGEFGHIPLNIDGPTCTCGSNGCWEAYISNIATVSRYLGRNMFEKNGDFKTRTSESDLRIGDIIARARSGDQKATDALKITGGYLGIGLNNIINAINPARIYIGGEITIAWDLIENDVRKALSERALTRSSAETPIQITTTSEYPRLRGAAALVAAPTFVAPRVG